MLVGGGLLTAGVVGRQAPAPEPPRALGSISLDSGQRALGAPPSTRAEERRADRRADRARRQGPRLGEVPGLDAPLPPSPPRHLHIPAIGVDTRVHGTGVDQRGSLQVPSPGPREDQAAWYRHSASPGSLGPAIIAGHVDTARGPSVFFRLGAVRPGDRVRLTRRDGWRLTYAVTGIRTVQKDRFPTALVYGGSTSSSSLRLITCALFDPDARTHVGNQIVFADLVRARPPRGG